MWQVHSEDDKQREQGRQKADFADGGQRERSHEGRAKTTRVRYAKKRIGDRCGIRTDGEKVSWWLLCVDVVRGC